MRSTRSRPRVFKLEKQKSFAHGYHLWYYEFVLEGLGTACGYAETRYQAMREIVRRRRKHIAEQVAERLTK